MSIAIARKIWHNEKFNYFPEMVGKVFDAGWTTYKIISYDQAYVIDPIKVMSRIHGMRESTRDYIFYDKGNMKLGSFYKEKSLTWKEQLEGDGFRML